MKYRLLKNYLEKFSDDRSVTGHQGKLAWHSSSLMFSKVMIFNGRSPRMGRIRISRIKVAWRSVLSYILLVPQEYLLYCSKQGSPSPQPLGAPARRSSCLWGKWAIAFRCVDTGKKIESCFQSDKSDIGARSGPVGHFLCCYILTFLQPCIYCKRYWSYGINECGDNKDRFDAMVFVIHSEVAGDSWNWQW